MKSKVIKIKDDVDNGMPLWEVAKKYDLEYDKQTGVLTIDIQKIMEENKHVTP